MVQILLEKSWILDILRSVIMLLDAIFYPLLVQLMQLIFDIANYTLDNSSIENLYDKVYLIISVFVLFRLTVSMLSYLVNPDKISDKKIGASKLIQRILISLMMLIMIPAFFRFLPTVQSALFQAVPRVILGTETDTSNFNEDTTANVGSIVSFQIFRTFFHYDMDCGLDNNNESVTITDDPMVMENADSDPYWSSWLHVNDECPDNSGNYQYTYIPVLPFIVNIVICIMLISIAIKVAIRMFKLIILRLIAPVPIISYMNPENDNTFNSYFKTLMNTWLSLFIYLGSMFLVLRILDWLFTIDSTGYPRIMADYFKNTLGKDISDPVSLVTYYFRTKLFMIFIVIALFIFAKDFPKFLTKALGIKDGDSFGSIIPNFGKVFAGGAAVAGSVGTGIASARASHEADIANGIAQAGSGLSLKNIGAGLFGGAAGLASGINTAVNAKDHSVRAVLDNAAKRNASIRKNGAAGGTFLGAIGSDVSSLLTGQSRSAVLADDWKREEEAIKYERDINNERKVIMDRASSKGLESLDTVGTVNKSSGPLARYNGFTANAASFNSAIAHADREKGQLTGYVSATGTAISEAKYNTLSDQDKLVFKPTYSGPSKYFTYNGTDILWEDLDVLAREINDLNIANYAERALDTNDTVINDTVITNANDRYESATGQSVEAKFGKIKAAFGATSDKLKERERKVADAKNSREAARAAANESRFKN